jgi:hypothetical protein
MPHILFVVLATALAVPTSAQAQKSAHDAAAKIVADIQRADYEGDRAALERLRDALRSIDTGGDARFTSRIQYWQGFAMWRRAVNAFNDAPDPKLLDRDLQLCVSDFDASLKSDSAFADAAIGTIGCLQTLAFLYRDDPPKIKEFVARFVKLFKETMQVAPDNPRMLWLLGGSQWYVVPGTPQDQLPKKQAQAFATYRRGLELARKQPRPASVLDPSWGEPELLMSLAWSTLNQIQPDPAGAEKLANEALAIVPHWHYVKDILMPQIRAAKGRD